jgi:hypothetical protein
MEDLSAGWLGLPWVNLWLQAWASWLEQWGMVGRSRPPGAAADQERRQPELPWVPQFEATVVPLRRRDDQPGAEAAKVSMRLRVPAFPWSPGTSNIIAIDTLMPRPVEPPDEEPSSASH